MTHVLAVCTGNICRSPATERLLAARLGARSGITIASAGTHALEGRPVDPPVAELLRAAGADPGSFGARQLTAAQIRTADLVLVMTRRHRSAVAALEPSAVRRTFLLLELAELARAVADAGWPAQHGEETAARLAALPGLVPVHRGRVGLPDRLEVEDPHRRSITVHARAVAGIAAAVDQLVLALRRPGGWAQVSPDRVIPPPRT
ncbi:hypothetical protein QOZ88_17210 [Blastococcus sp. BMG 814]|uniref:Phosphotyrosine protein phosphatase I domain-containing protein n=1 Tax=Blastococcus carthaginiensis TaxID=3050034 RepID=A0ABT9IFM7_9ACTN|nr:hypothetical protein [Blastococcus carthaginiensis]MDP5184376.1 hypothetical protein [Blastococcus carthaginiensis]